MSVFSVSCSVRFCSGLVFCLPSVQCCPALFQPRRLLSSLPWASPPHPGPACHSSSHHTQHPEHPQLWTPVPLARGQELGSKPALPHTSGCLLSGLSSSLHRSIHPELLWVGGCSVLPGYIQRWSLCPHSTDGQPRKADTQRWPSMASECPASGMCWARPGRLADCLPLGAHCLEGEPDS